MREERARAGVVMLNAIDMMRLGWATSLMALDSQQVIAMRLMGFGGFWPIAHDEGNRMVREKASAYTEAMLTTVFLGLSGTQPGRIATETVAPLSRTARSNRLRLAGKRAHRARRPLSTGAYQQNNGAC